jgi:hypothetical protein
MASDSTILERVLAPERGDFPAEVARHILALDFPPADHARYESLSAKASDENLNPQERIELEEYLNVNDFLTAIKAKARASLRRQERAA